MAFSCLGPTHEWCGGVSLQPCACSRWTRAPASIMSCSGITTQRQTPAGPSSLGDAKGTATALKPSGGVSSSAEPQQVRQPLSPPDLLFLQPGKPIHHPPTSIALWCPTSTKKELEGMPLVCKVSFPPTPSSLWSPSVPPRSPWIRSLGPGPLGMQVDLWVMRRVPMATSTGS